MLDFLNDIFKHETIIIWEEKQAETACLNLVDLTELDDDHA